MPVTTLALPWRAASRLGLAVLGMALLGDCSLFNRYGPETTCAELMNGAVNDCADGIIATCEAGAVAFRVCDDSAACDATWQVPGHYRCDQDGGAGGGGAGLPAAPMQLVAAEVAADTNGDGTVSPGETASLRLRVRNNRDLDADAVEGDLTTAAPGVTLLEATRLRFGDISAGSDGCGVTLAAPASPGSCFSSSTSYPSLVVDATVAAGTVIPLQLALRDGLGNTWTQTTDLALPSIAQGFVLATVEVQADDNDDGRLSPGESGRVKLRVRNTGSSAALGISGALSVTSGSATVSEGIGLRFGDIEPGQDACGVTLGAPASAGSCFSSSTSYPGLAIPTSVAAGQSLGVSLVLTDTYGNSVPLSTVYPISAIDQAFDVVAIEIADDPNDDGVISAGETGRLRLRVRNTGSVEALGLTTSLTTTHAAATVSEGNGLRLGAIDAGQTSCAVTASAPAAAGSCFSSSTSYPTLAIEIGTAAGTTIPLTLTLTDAFDNVFVKDVSYIVAAIDQNFSVQAATLVDDDDQDMMVSPGETATVRITLQNTGSADALGVTANLSTNQAGVSVIAGAGLAFGNLPAGGTACGRRAAAAGNAGSCFLGDSSYPAFSVAGGVSVGTQIPFTLQVLDTYGNAFDRAFSITVVP